MMREARMRGSGLLLLAGCLMAWSFFAPQADAAGLLIADGGFGGVLQVKEHNVRVVINNGVAVTEVEQVFVNAENRPVEALYTFPVPKGASVANFSMWIGGKEMVGEVVEKDRARQIYESYKQTRRDPGLLEQVDFKSFEMRIFPIAAQAEQRVKVTYYQELEFDHDWAVYVYPLATVTRANVDPRVSGKFGLTLDVKSEVPIVKMESPSHADGFVIQSHTSNYCQASLETPGGQLNRDLVITFKTSRPRTGLDVISSRQANEDGYFMLTLTAGEELAEQLGGMDYVFILDVSGSMATDGKLRLSRESLFAFFDALGDQDRFEVITFNVSPNTLFNELAKVNSETKGSARTFLESQSARGGTVLRPAITTAYRYQDSDRPLNVVVLSDGMTEQDDQRELLQLIGQRPSGTKVFCIGVGNEVNRPLLQQLATSAGGLASFLSQEDSFERQAQAFRRKLMRPAISEAKLAFQGAGVYDLEPEALPNLYHGSPVRVYGRYKKAGPATVAIEGNVLGKPFKQNVEISLPAGEPANPEIERMWAWHRVDRLLADERREGSSSSHRDEVVRLCEGYSIVSPYASFIVLENDREYQRWKIDRRNAARVERDRVAQIALRKQLEQIRNQAAQNLGPAKADRLRDEQLAKGNAAQPNLSDSTTPASPVVPDAQTPTPEQSSGSSNRQANDTSRGIDFDLPSLGGGGGGGGAIDPITAALGFGLAGASLWAARRRKTKHTAQPQV